MSGAPKEALVIDGIEVVVARGFPRVVKLRSEYFEVIPDPMKFLRGIRDAKIKADVFTFVQPRCNSAHVPTPHFTLEKKAVLGIHSYEHWWKSQINDKTRNMVRKAAKKGVAVEVTAFDDNLLNGIKQIYDECPMRQGKPFVHYDKDMLTLHRAHATFLHCSDFIGAFFNGELIGFAKVVHLRGWSALMHIISKNSHRDKAPTNALIAKAVEICASKNIAYLMYGMWSRRSLGDFKRHHGFECMNFARCFVPLNGRGKLALVLKLHKPLVEIGLNMIPEAYLDRLAQLRTYWYLHKLRRKRLGGAVAQSAEPRAF